MGLLGWFRGERDLIVYEYEDVEVAAVEVPWQDRQLPTITLFGLPVLIAWAVVNAVWQWWLEFRATTTTKCVLR